MNSRTFFTFGNLLSTSTVILISFLLLGCGASSDTSSNSDGVLIEFDDKPSLFFMFNSKKETDNQGGDTYYSFVGESISFPRHIFSNSDHTNLDVSESYWTDSSNSTIQDNNEALTVSDSHKPAVKACMIPKLSNGKTNTVTCVTFEVRDLPGLTQKIRMVSIFSDNDHFQAGLQLSELEPNDIRMIEGTKWQYRWFDSNGNVLKKSGDAIIGYKLNYADIDESIKQVKTCVFGIVTQQCVKESNLELVPSNNVPAVSILDITGEYKQGGKVSPESRTSYAYTQPAAGFIYEWAVVGVVLSDVEKTAAELTLKDASYFETDITVCMQRAYKNFTGSGTTMTTRVCKTKQFTESDVQVTASYNYGNNLLAQKAPFVFSGSFNGLDAIDYSTFKLSYQDKILTQGVDYSITTFGYNDFTFKIHSQQAIVTAGYGPLLKLQCEFTYNGKSYSCIGGTHASNSVGIYADGGLPSLQSRVKGAIAEKNRVDFLYCAAGDKLTWWLKDKDASNYVQTGPEEIIEAGAYCYGGNPDGTLYINEGWAGKMLKLIVKRARNGLSDERIQVLDIDLGEISK